MKNKNSMEWKLEDGEGCLFWMCRGLVASWEGLRCNFWFCVPWILILKICKTFSHNSYIQLCNACYCLILAYSHPIIAYFCSGSRIIASSHLFHHVSCICPLICHNLLLVNLWFCVVFSCVLMLYLGLLSILIASFWVSWIEVS